MSTRSACDRRSTPSAFEGNKIGKSSTFARAVAYPAVPLFSAALEATTVSYIASPGHLWQENFLFVVDGVGVWIFVVGVAFSSFSPPNFPLGVLFSLVSSLLFCFFSSRTDLDLSFANRMAALAESPIHSRGGLVCLSGRRLNLSEGGQLCIRFAAAIVSDNIMGGYAGVDLGGYRSSERLGTIVGSESDVGILFPCPRCYGRRC